MAARLDPPWPLRAAGQAYTLDELDTLHAWVGIGDEWQDSRRRQDMAEAGRPTGQHHRIAARCTLEDCPEAHDPTTRDAVPSELLTAALRATTDPAAVAVTRPGRRLLDLAEIGRRVEANTHPDTADAALLAEVRRQRDELKADLARVLAQRDTHVCEPVVDAEIRCGERCAVDHVWRECSLPDGHTEPHHAAGQPEVTWR